MHTQNAFYVFSVLFWTESDIWRSNCFIIITSWTFSLSVTIALPLSVIFSLAPSLSLSLTAVISLMLITDDDVETRVKIKIFRMLCRGLEVVPLRSHKESSMTSMCVIYVAAAKNLHAAHSTHTHTHKQFSAQILQCQEYHTSALLTSNT